MKLSLNQIVLLAADCIEEPTQSNCRDFKLADQNATQLVDDLCTSMPLMSESFCKPFSLLADICANDMPRMKTCATYIKMCDRTSLIHQCTDELPIPALPTTKRAKELVADICSEMDMNGCEKCEDGKRCEALAVYGDLCKEMPFMSQCKEWQTMCTWDSSLPICSQDFGSKAGPTMKMYFHFGYRDYIMFESWVPSNGWEYALGCLFCFAFAIAYEYLLYLGAAFESKIRTPVKLNLSNEASQNEELVELERGPSSAATNSPLMASTAFPNQMLNNYWSPFKIKLVRSLLRLVTVSGAYICMLLVMSFNVGHFLSVVIGLGVGCFAFSDKDPLASFRVEKEHCNN
ncbi:hypothetical protein HDV02_004332 [Globomyces sp. JEL0801]|nr:hypothetical protein HDV02_004332 [Globomyces sp. JEL0801]